MNYNKDKEIIAIENEIKTIFNLKKCFIDFIPNAYNFIVNIMLDDRVKNDKRKKIEDYIYSTISGIDDVWFNRNF